MKEQEQGNVGQQLERQQQRIDHLLEKLPLLPQVHLLGGIHLNENAVCFISVLVERDRGRDRDRELLVQRREGD